MKLVIATIEKEKEERSSGSVKIDQVEKSSGSVIDVDALDVKKEVKQEVEEEVLTPGEASSGRQPRAKERGPGRPRRGAGVAEAAAADCTQKRLSDFFNMSPQGNVDASVSSLFARPFDNPVPTRTRWK